MSGASGPAEAEAGSWAVEGALGQLLRSLAEPPTAEAPPVRRRAVLAAAAIAAGAALAIIAGSGFDPGRRSRPHVADRVGAAPAPAADGQPWFVLEIDRSTRPAAPLPHAPAKPDEAAPVLGQAPPQGRPGEPGQAGDM